MFHVARSASLGLTVPGTCTSKCKHRRPQREGRTGKCLFGLSASSKREVFSEEGATFDMHIIVGTVAVCSFLADPVLLLFPAQLHPHQCQLYIGSQQLPAISCFLLCFVLFESTCVFVCHGNFTPAPRVGSVVFQQL